MISILKPLPKHSDTDNRVHYIFKLIKSVLDFLITHLVIICVFSFVIAVLGGIITRQLIKPLLAYLMAHSSGEGEQISKIMLFLNKLGAGTGDFAKIMLVWVTMSASALMFADRGHLGVDYFVGKMGESAQTMMKVFGYLIVFLFTIGVLIIGGIKLTDASWAQQMQNIPVSKGIVYLMVPLGGFFTLFYLVYQVFCDIFSWDDSNLTDAKEIDAAKCVKGEVK